MNGAQDMGGMMGFGPVVAEQDEPVFHAAWERRAFALTLAMAGPGGWNIDQSRAARESLHPAQYLAKSYYEIWLAGLEKLMAERGLITAEEIAAGASLEPGKPVTRVLAAARVESVLARGRPTERAALTPAGFQVGERVRARNLHPTGHTRLPRYVRGHVGRVTHVHGAHVLPDAHAAGLGEDPQWLYTVRFAAQELWGEAADRTASVAVDAWESYLEAV
ncbi:MAG TPA: nitrile hydratase subunit beta [Hyphomicrobiaceae bacterium]|nr:nitrile hydratase subunit beta [Hyphomicrobiaceae bacterium]